MDAGSLYERFSHLLHEGESLTLSEHDRTLTAELILPNGGSVRRIFSITEFESAEVPEIPFSNFVRQARSELKVFGSTDTWSTTPSTPSKTTLSSSDVHKAVRNCVHNELKLTREDIVAMIEPRIDAEIKKALGKYIQQKFEQGDLRKMFRAEIAEYMSKERHVGFTKMSFQDYLDRLIREEIRSLLISKLDISVEVKG